MSDVGLALHAVVERDGGSPGFQVFNLGGDDGLSLHELGQLIGRVLGVTPWFEFVGGEEPGGWMADSSKLKKALGLGPFVPVEEGIRRAVYE